jgi:hypothetical protein
MKLFPHSMIRISGGPFEKLESLKIKDSIRIIDTIFNHKEKLGTLKQTLSDEFYHVIPQQKDPALQNLMLKVRRDIFNERDISPEKIKRITPHLPETLAEHIENYRQIKEKINRLRDEGETVFAEECVEARKRFKTLAADQDFQKGLLLGSQSLYKQVTGYMKKDPAARMKKKDGQVERGLTKYFSRMHGKTSPFSTFTNLAIGKITPNPKPPLPKNKISPLLRLKEDEKAEVVYHIRLNNYLYNYLKILLTRNPTISRCLLLRPNPTIQKNEDHYLYLTNSNNIEAFQRIPANPALEVFRLLSSRDKQGIVYREMIRAIIDNEYIDAPAEELEGFVDQLIDYGFLEFDLGVSGIDPDWDKKLIKKLKHLEKELPLIKELLDTLKKVRTLANQYSSSDCQKRTQILEEAFQQFKTICMKLHEDAGLPEEERKSPEELRKIQEEQRKKAEEEQEAESKEEQQEPREQEEEDQPFKQISSTYFNFTPEKMFYEDTSLNIQPELDKQQIRQFTDTAHRLLQKMERFEGHFDEQNKMLHYFVNKYGKDTSVDLMTFYEDYYREYKKPEAQRQEAQRQPAREKEEQEQAEKEKADLPELPTIPAIQQRQEKNKQWTDQFKSLLEKRLDKNADVVNIGLQDIEKTDQMFPDAVEKGERDCSYGSFVQYFVEEEPGGKEILKGVLSASFPGFGKMFSRFLHIFPDTVTEDMRAWNRSLIKEDQIFLEDSDASFFNANLHPPLMPHEIHMPNGQNSLPPENQVPITELQVKVDETGSQLQLLHTPGQKRVYAFDLGFQGHRGRSQLFQLLEKFTLTEFLFCYPMLTAINGIFTPQPQPQPDKKEEKEDKEEKVASERNIRTIPRVVYEDRIVLQRKTWFIPEEQLPYRKPDESEWAWFYRVNEWRRQQGMRTQAPSAKANQDKPR